MEIGDVTHLGERVACICLPLPLEGLPSVNCYVLLGDDSVTLIDPGWASEETRAGLERGLAKLGRTPDDVSQILVTHHHWDHYTQALALRQERDIPVLLGREEQHSIRAWRELEGAYPRQVGLLESAGADSLASRVAQMEYSNEELGMTFHQPSGWLDDGDLVDCDGLSVQVHATPGHTRGHVVFVEPEQQLYFTGDHVLPHVTPSIAYEREPSPDSLINYLDSLHLLRGLCDGTILPAHRDVAPSVHLRVAELLAHHDERLETVCELVGAGHATAYEVASHMRWTHSERRLNDLDTVHAMTAVLEVAAHLTWLQRAGVIHCTEEQPSRFTVAGSPQE